MLFITCRLYKLYCILFISIKRLSFIYYSKKPLQTKCNKINPRELTRLFILHNNKSSLAEKGTMKDFYCTFIYNITKKQTLAKRYNGIN